jgi:hypothetical protein
MLSRLAVEKRKSKSNHTRPVIESHRLTSASELSTRNFTDFSSLAKTISALRKKRRKKISARPFVEMCVVRLSDRRKNHQSGVTLNSLSLWEREIAPAAAELNHPRYSVPFDEGTPV